MAGIAIAVATFRWEPHRPAKRRPARSSQQAGPGPRMPPPAELADLPAGNRSTSGEVRT